MGETGCCHSHGPGNMTSQWFEQQWKKSHPVEWLVDSCFQQAAASWGKTAWHQIGLNRVTD